MFKNAFGNLYMAAMFLLARLADQQMQFPFTSTAGTKEGKIV